jgi:DNA invertase Pin-like site-specific DNA recombinase
MMKESLPGAHSDQSFCREKWVGSTLCALLRDRRVYKDRGISGTRGRDKRPAFDKLCHDAGAAQIRRGHGLVGRPTRPSLQDLLGFLSELHALKIDLFLRQQGLDATTPAGKAMFQMMGVFAEFERAMIAERVRAGLRAGQG